MSVSFYLRSAEVAYPACKRCGGTLSWKPRPNPYCDAEECGGYGPAMVESVPSLNLSNVNFQAFMTEVLDYEKPDWCGELDPDDVMSRLERAPLRASRAVREVSFNDNMISCGLSLQRIHFYCDRLAFLAKVAKRRRENVAYD
tara:strand:+ start:2492 stop:2920 length:429 start_codon:yes stop_codon:yes gene_type:complete